MTDKQQMSRADVSEYQERCRQFADEVHELETRMLMIGHDMVDEYPESLKAQAWAYNILQATRALHDAFRQVGDSQPE